MENNNQPKELQVELINKNKKGENLYTVKQDDNVYLYAIRSNTVRMVGDLNELKNKKTELEKQINDKSKKANTAISQNPHGTSGQVAQVIAKNFKKEIKKLEAELQDVEKIIKQIPQNNNSEVTGGNRKRPRRTYKLKNSKSKTRKSKRKTRK
jgi:hypothetical protein